MATPQQEPWRATFHEITSPIEEIIEEARNGRMFILVDNEDRENEGDLVIPAQMATPEAINFMATHGRGLICLALTPERIEELGLPLMAQKNASRHGTAFTVSIEAREGVTTGISAPDRARTIAVAIDPSKGAADVATPGHVFPLMARDGGVLSRSGHTEAAVDVARLAGLSAAGVICEIMNDDGTMARRDDLIAFAQKHGLKIATIADLIAYRRAHDRIIERAAETTFDSRYGGEFNLTVFRNVVDGGEHIALWKGDISAGPALVRVHALDLLDDVLGDSGSGRGGEMQEALRLISEEGRGVVVLIDEHRPQGLSERVKRRIQKQGWVPESELRDYGLGAQILLDLGVRQMILLHNTKHTFVGMEGFGLTVVDQRPIRTTAEEI
ncbi:MAG: 3,4-dihydroxy-2-butanone-4-phosphate synthase [Rhodovibrionaceae bacterium]